MTAPRRASSSAKEVSIRQAISGVPDRISRQTSMPSPSGRRTSRDRDIGVSNRYSRQRLGCIRCLCDDLKVVLGFEQLTHAASDDLMVIKARKTRVICYFRRNCNLDIPFILTTTLGAF